MGHQGGPALPGRRHVHPGRPGVLRKHPRHAQGRRREDRKRAVEVQYRHGHPPEPGHLCRRREAVSGRRRRPNQRAALVPRQDRRAGDRGERRGWGRRRLRAERLIHPRMYPAVRRFPSAWVWGASLMSVVSLAWGQGTFAQAPVAREPKAPEAGSDAIAEGRSLFNQYCSHCHGPNAVQGERPRDLRRLVLRYGQRAPEVFWQSVTSGRPDKGMPVWKGTLSDDTLRRILTYLQTVQSPP